MKLSALRPYLLFWLAMPFILVLGYVGEGVFDVQIGSHYWLLDRRALGLNFAGYLGLTGLVYWLLAQRGRQPQWPLTLIHLTVTVGFFALVLNYTGWASEYRGELIERTATEAIDTIRRRFDQRQLILGVGGLFFGLAQLAFGVNCVLAALRR